MSSAHVPEWSELKQAYAGKRVFLTGHTGFKGAWLLLWLRELGAEVYGYALAPDQRLGIFEALALEKECHHRVADVRDPKALAAALDEAKPDYVFHLAAQPLVRRSYELPIETIEINGMGTANVLEAIRKAGRPVSAVMVTTDKCYENREWVYGYREDEPLGGHDVYSMSKALAELIVSSYRRSFFAAKGAQTGIKVCSARAGNVVGGGDFADDRIVPDAIRALRSGKPIGVRNPKAIRPWQHVLEPLGGYLLLGARLAGVGTTTPDKFAEAWNFGPPLDSSRPVRDLANALVKEWGGQGSWEDKSDPNAVHEAQTLKLSIEKAHGRLSWQPRWDFNRTMAETARWYRVQADGADRDALRKFTVEQLRDYAAGK